jgi:acyl-CoA-binding protein
MVEPELPHFQLSFGSSHWSCGGMQYRVRRGRRVARRRRHCCRETRLRGAQGNRGSGAIALTAFQARAINVVLPAEGFGARILLRSTAMADLKTQFEQAAKDIKDLAERPDNDTLLKLYALYKQGSEGDVNGPKPGFFDFVGTAKYEAWAKLKGTAPDEAQKKYVDLVKKLRS